MDQIAKLNSKVIPLILEPTFKILSPLLIVNQSRILSVPRETRRYGAYPRQTLDIYSPLAGFTGSTPIVIFLYGGGLTRGDKILTDIPQSLMYHNLGTFFPLRSFTIIIPDYRRVGDPKVGTGEGATYPSGGEDVAAVLEWLHSASYPLQSLNKQHDVFIVGNSAGEVCIWQPTYLMYGLKAGGNNCLMDLARIGCEKQYY